MNGNRLRIVGLSGMYLFSFSILFWITYNFVFGWNLYPESDIERYFDTYFNLMIGVSSSLYFYPFFSIYNKIIVYGFRDS